MAGDAAAGAGAGAAGGSLFGPWGTAIGAVVGLTGGIIKGVSAKNAADANAAVDQQNAAVANQAAGTALANGQQQATMRAMQGSRTAGAQTAGFAASGVSASAGSALDVLGDTALVSKEDQDVIQNNAARTAWGYQTQASNFQQKAGLDEQEGSSEEVGDILGGVSGAASAASQIKLGK